MKRTMLQVGALSLVLAAPALLGGTTEAARSQVTGTIDLMPTTSADARVAESDAGLSHGDMAMFDTTINGRVSNKASVYVTVACWQGDTVVYQYSAAPDFHFPLVDQAGQGLEWHGGHASCNAYLIHRVDKGKSSDITVLDTEAFLVSA